ncbi:MAG: hypothetical protein Q8J84_08420 [Flavobacteriaceae bacterium]|nr:hypothetical protein [Flavobacteriaceae bacterium]
MKKEITLKVLKYALGLVMLIMVSSCTDDLNSVEFNGLDAELVAQGADSRTAAKGGSGGVTTQNAFVSVLSWPISNGTVCKDEAITFTFQGWDGTKQANIAIWNETINDWVPFTNNTGQNVGPLTGVHTFGAVGTYKLGLHVSGNADKGGTSGWKEYFITVINCSFCNESFSYAPATGVDTYTFTYIPSESLTNKLVVFTFAQAVAISGFDNTWSNNGQTMQKNMDFAACETYTWTVTLVKNCSGSSGASNVWTDFKVGGVSKKSTLTPNIVVNCN